ncbi:MAG: hypothetical protein AMJ90_04010 [candidate division Zixibacteria bacterium SM23_73_2]|nr:MAG: hypothetical protein AMJ90_04010 [candidate division Zixibacteria bacterium SM23_73_2]
MSWFVQWRERRARRRLTSKDLFVRYEAAKWLLLRRGDASVIAVLLECLHESDYVTWPLICEFAAATLSRYGYQGPRPINGITNRLRKTASASQAGHLLRALSYLAPRDALDAIEIVLNRDSTYFRVDDANTATGAAILPTFTGTTGQYVRVLAARLLGDFGNESSVNTLRSAAVDADSQVRAAAVSALETIQGRSAPGRPEAQQP